MNPADVDVFVANAVRNALGRGAQPGRILVGVRAYRALVERDGLAPRSIGKVNATSLRAHVDGFDLPIDCDRSVGDGDAICQYVAQEMGKA